MRTLRTGQERREAECEQLLTEQQQPGSLAAGGRVSLEPLQGLTLLTAQAWTSGLLNFDRIGFCCFKCLVQSNLFWQPQEISIASFFPSTEYCTRIC